MLSDKEISEIEKRLEAASDAPWAWSQTYEMQYEDHGKVCSEYHWCLHNPASDKEGMTIDASLVVLHSSANYFSEPFHTRPNANLIAHAPADIASLLQDRDELVERVKKQDEVIEFMGKRIRGEAQG